MRRSVLIAAAVVFLSTAFAADLPEHRPDPNALRSAIPAVYQWDFSPLFRSDEAWDKARIQLLQEFSSLNRYRGKLSDPRSLRECLDLYFRLHKDANLVALYSSLRKSVAQSDDSAESMSQQGISVMDELMRTAAFMRQEVLALKGPALEAAVKKEPGLAPYRIYIDNLRRREKRSLSPDAERALSLLGDNLWAEIDLNDMPSIAEDLYGALISDMPWPKIKNERGEEVPFSLSGLTVLRRAANRDVRRGAYGAYLQTLRQYEHALAAALGGQVKLDIAYAKSRSYETALEAYLDKDGIHPAVYDNLVRTVNANVSLLHRYVALRKKLLGLPDIQIYDLFVPLASDVDEDIPFARGRDAILKALEPLGADYGRILREGLDPANGWVDLYPHKDKERGAYSAGFYSPRPYILMNYLNSINDVSTLAHEYGHAVHSYLSIKNQPYPNFRYATMLAEIASTCNEWLLSDYLLSQTDDPVRKAYLLTERLERIRTTIFRQTMFAEFEREIHRLSEQGTPLTATLLDGAYLGLVKKYYGPGFTTGPNDGMEWAGVPHFYFKYYVWTYATGLAAGIDIADRVRSKGAGTVSGYLEMLKGGCSDSPLSLLKKAGVDLTKPDAIAASMHAFEKTLNALEKLMAK